MSLKIKQSGAASRAMGVAAIILTSGTGSVCAQGNVTIYGTLDTGIERVTNVGPTLDTVFRMPGITGSIPSRLGFRGTEDLGDGLNANFVLEQGISLDTGTLNQAGRVFGRQAYVGISGRWGSVSFGRQYSQIFWALIGDTMGPNLYSMGDLDPYLPNARVDNTIAYRGTFGALSVGATFSLGRDAVASVPAGGCAGESTTDRKACRLVSALVQYATPVWGLALATERQYGGGGVGSPLPLSSQTDTRTVLNGFYKVAGATIGGGIVKRRNEGSPTPDRHMWWAGATYWLGSWVFDVQYGQLDVKDSSDAATLIAGRLQYLLSKRTALYFTAGRMNNDGASALTIDGGVVAGANPPPGVGQTGTMVGLRHSF